MADDSEVGGVPLALGVQRRQLTILFSDLVGSTEMSTQIDPEDLHRIMSAFQRRCAECVEAAGGYVARFMGDGLLAYFGYPVGHEDDAARAVQAALMISRAVPELESPSAAKLSVRSGIATGLVVVGDLIRSGLAQERAVVGTTPNLAARLQAAAPSNTVLVSHLTRRLAADLFEFRPLGSLALKGLPDQMAWEVLGENPNGRPTRPSGGADTTPFVGREADLALILDRWRRCAAGEGHVIGVVGEPGIGKSRLVREVGARIAREPHLWLEGGTAQVFRNTSLHAIAQMIRRRLAGANAADPPTLKRLERLLAVSGVDAVPAAMLLADLAGLETPDPLQAETAAAKREREIAILREWLIKSAARWPTVMVLEDLQWADPSTLELLDGVLEGGAPPGLLLIYTTRDPAAAAAWPLADRHLQVTLQSLDRPDTRRLIVARTGGQIVGDALERLITRAGGVPLFAEELARLVRETGASERDIPATLSDLLTARLDQLGSAKSLAQIASVLGAKFQPRLLGAVSGLSDAELTSSLEALVASGVVTQVGGDGPAAYAFRHALIEDAAYDALLKSDRRTLHLRAAEVISRTFAGADLARPEVLAQHWSRAEKHDQALEAWHAAARAAQQRRAHGEAEAAYAQALETLMLFPEDAWRETLELELQGSYASVLQITRGYSSPIQVAASTRARELAERRGELKTQFDNAVSVWTGASSSGEYATASPLAERLLSLARAAGDDETLGKAYMSVLTARYRVGDLAGSEHAFEIGEPFFETRAFRSVEGAIPQTYGNAAVVAWLAGDLAKARRRTARMLVLCRRSDSKYERAFARYMAAALAILSSNAASAIGLARRAISISDDVGYQQPAATSRIVLGRALAECGEPALGVETLTEGLRRAEEARIGAWATLSLTWLAEAQAYAGDRGAALATLDRALDVNPLETCFRPHTLRLRGDLRAAAGDGRGAEADYRQAVELARSIGSPQLRRLASEALARWLAGGGATA